MNKVFIFTILILIIPFSQAAALQGSIYSSDLKLETDVLLEVSTTPVQKYLSKDGTYSFQLPAGKYQLTAKKGFNSIVEEIEIEKDGTFILDLFLSLDLNEEESLWQDTEQEFFIEEAEESQKYEPWRYILASVILLFLAVRFAKIRKKHGSLKAFRKKVMENKEIRENDQEQLEEVLNIIKKHEGRIKQKTLRKELLHWSEAKISLIVTELEHKGKIEKIKKGRGNIIILRP